MVQRKKQKKPDLFLKTEFMLADPFRATGRWWLSSNKRRKTHGTLSYTQTDIELELSGALERVDSRELATIGKKLADPPCIHGQSDEGKKFTLLKSFASQYGSTTKYAPIYVIEGMHTPPLSKLKLTTVSFYCSYLDTFIACALFGIRKKRMGMNSRGRRSPTFSRKRRRGGFPALVRRWNSICSPSFAADG
jgi:hypothetical protein